MAAREFFRKLKRLFDDKIKWNIGEVICKKMFRFWQYLGFHITRNFFYEPIPDTRTLKDKLWQTPAELVGIEMNDSSQLNLLGDVAKFRNEYDLFPKDPQTSNTQFYLTNPHFQAVDAEILYGMIRHFQPNKIYEIGSGYSTFLMAQAVLKNQETNNHQTEFIAFDPDPRKSIKRGLPGLSKLEIVYIEDLDIHRFSELGKGDILFIDSSHVLRIGGDVKYEFLEILPRLQKGVLVHIHDIFLPYEYPKEWVLGDYRFWTEQYLLQAFLSFNNEFEILWAGYSMHRKYPDKLKAAFSAYDPKFHSPASFWVQRKV